jgi:hypothetical protein
MQTTGFISSFVLALVMASAGIDDISNLLPLEP